MKKNGSVFEQYDWTKWRLIPFDHVYPTKDKTPYLYRENGGTKQKKTHVRIQLKIVLFVKEVGFCEENETNGGKPDKGK